MFSWNVSEQDVFFFWLHKFTLYYRGLGSRPKNKSIENELLLWCDNNATDTVNDCSSLRNEATTTAAVGKFSGSHCGCLPDMTRRRRRRWVTQCDGFLSHLFAKLRTDLITNQSGFRSKQTFPERTASSAWRPVSSVAIIKTARDRKHEMSQIGPLLNWLY